MSKEVFITGATGYVGGAALAHLLENPSTKSYKYTALVRNKEKAAILESFGVRPVIATLEDVAVLAAEAQKADIVIHTAGSSDNLPACQTILSAMEKRNDNPILIHISGTGLLIDDARGEFCTEEVYSDLDSERINNVSDDAPHRKVDLAVIGAAPRVRTHILLPPVIYGVADHALVKANIANNQSVQIPGMTLTGIDRGQGGVESKGRNVWSNVHISDVATAIGVILEAAVAGKTAVGREGYYFAETGEASWYDLSVEISRALHAHGIGKPEPTPFTDAELQKYFGAYGGHIMGTNSRCRADRMRQLGWTSKRTAEDCLNSIALDVACTLKKVTGNR